MNVLKMFFIPVFLLMLACTSNAQWSTLSIEQTIEENILAYRITNNGTYTLGVHYIIIQDELLFSMEGDTTVAAGDFIIIEVTCLNSDCAGYEISATENVINRSSSSPKVNSEQPFKVIPNLNNNTFRVYFQNEIITPASIELLNLQGKVVYKNDKVMDRILSIKYGNLPTGLYFLRVIIDQQQYSQKIVLR